MRLKARIIFGHCILVGEIELQSFRGHFRAVPIRNEATENGTVVTMFASVKEYKMRRKAPN